MSLYLLYRDFNDSGEAVSGSELATVQAFERSVRRKSAQNFLWVKVNQGQGLYLKDSVQTGNLSTAALRLKNGALVELGENSLFVLNDLNDLSLGFIKGSALISQGSQDTRISVGADGEKKIEKVPYQLRYPRSLDELYFQGPSKKLSFTFAGPNPTPGESLFVDLYSENSLAPLQRIPVSSTATNEVFQVPVELSISGLYRWQLTNKDGKALTTKRSFKFTKVLALQSVSPKNAESIKSWGDEALVEFFWQRETPSDEKIPHWLEISSDEKFRKIVRKEKVFAQEGQAQVKELKNGRYFWRLRSEYPEFSLSTQAQEFQVENSPFIPLVLQEPAQKAKLEKRENLLLAWEASLPLNKVTYLLKLKHLSLDGKQNQTEHTTQALRLNLKNPQPGSYEWQIVALQEGSQKVMGQSEKGTFSLSSGEKLRLTKPQNESRIEYWHKGTPIDFEWDALAHTNHFSYFEIETAIDPDFKSVVVTQKSPTPKISLSHPALNDGEYYWRVVAKNAQGLDLALSPIYSFRYGMKPLLEAPKGIEFSNHARRQPSSQNMRLVYNLMERAEFPTLAWLEVPEALEYQVEIYKESQPEALFRERVKQASFKCPPIKEGRYYFKVSAVDQASRVGTASSPQNFTISYGKPLQAPKVRSPEVQ